MAELKINALNQLKLLKQSTFKDPLCFLDEDIQNAQRAKANNVKITTEYYRRKLIIFNDGDVLDDPQKLFSIAESGWDDTTVKAENPFGIGFFSNIVVSDNILIQTGDKKIEFDVNKMLVDGDTHVETIIVDDPDEYVDGFKITLNNFDFNKYTESEIRTRAQDLANYIDTLYIYFNNTELESIPKTQPDEKFKFTQVVQNEMCEGWLAIGTNYTWDNELAVYYKGRLVTTLSNMYYIAGKLHINDNILNLVAPDRKDIIRDDNYSEFCDMVRSEMAKLCNKTALLDDDDLNNYSSCIKRYFVPDDIKNDIRFITFKTKDSNDMNYLSSVAISYNNNDSIKSFKDYEISLKDAEQKITNDITIDMPAADIEINTKQQYNDDETDTSSKSTKKDNQIETSLKNIGYDESDTSSIKCSSLTQAKAPIFYMKFSDMNTLSTKIAIARTYDLRIVITRNDIEYDILEKMNMTDSGEPVIHISALKEDISICCSLTNTSLTAKEKRASMIFDMISQMFEYESNMFVIGKLNVIKTITIASIDKTISINDNSIKILYSEDNNAIFIDRSIINDTKLTPNLSSKLNIRDMQFILANLTNIAKAIDMQPYGKHSNYETNKNEKKILDLLSRYEPSKNDVNN